MKLSEPDKFDPKKYDKRGRFLTHTGNEIDIRNFRIKDVEVEEIAHSLSLVCRYGGHCRTFYSVAQHAVLVARYIEDLGYPVEVVLAGLHHDDSEAYLGDVIRPLKQLLPKYKEIEEYFEGKIAKAFKIPFPYPPIVKEADMAIFRQEVEDCKWDEPDDPVIVPWTWRRAKREYLKMHERLMNQRIKESEIAVNA